MPTQGEVDRKRLIDVPLYTTWDVVRYLRVPLWLPLALQVPELKPSFSWTIDDMLGVVRQYEGVIPQDGADLSFKEIPLPRLSFRKLASLFVLSAVACPTSPFNRTSHHDWSDRLAWLGDFISDGRWLTNPDWIMQNCQFCFPQVFVTSVHKKLTNHQSRVERDDLDPVRLFPFLGAPGLGAPRTVVIDPEIRFGRPTVKGVPTDIVAERSRAGDTISELAEDYGLTIQEVEDALHFERLNSFPR